MVLHGQPAPPPAAFGDEVDGDEDHGGGEDREAGDLVQCEPMAEDHGRRHRGALVAAGHRHPAPDHLGRHKRQGQRENRQIEHLEAACAETEHEADGRGDQHRDHDDHRQRVAVSAKESCGIGADRDKAHVAD